MSYHSRMILPPGSGPSRKRKEREDKQRQQQQQPFYYSSLKPSSAQVPRAEPIPFKPALSSSSESSPKPKPSSNRLLAGYMAHEFLTKGTLLGQKFDPARTDTVPIGAEPVLKRAEQESYSDVANLLKGDGAHIQGVVNPTQLARWIQM